MGIHDGHREHMRRRFLSSDLEGFADHEVLELLLQYAIPRKDTNSIAHALMDRYGSLGAVLSASAEDLTAVPGVGERSAALIRLAGQIGSRAAVRRDSPALTSVEEVGAYLLPLYIGAQQEIVYQLCLDRKCKLLTTHKLGKGSADRAGMDVRQIVHNALSASASMVILAHNHPSGVALPSAEDYAATDRVRGALKAVGVQLADHIIVADGDFVSMHDSGYLD